jgi:putative RNA 2'-phosphotransferase
VRKSLISKSKFLSLVLRHKPEAIGVKMDANGWVNISELLNKAKGAGKYISKQELAEIVETNEKKRFIISEDGQRIRANQGHSIAVDVELKEAIPPEFLYHGTADRNIDAILQAGLKKQGRLHVHLSPDSKTAVKVGQRHGKPSVLRIKAKAMAADGYQFFLSKNGVWLVDNVPPQYLDIDR